MTLIPTAFDTSSPEAKANRESMSGLVEELRAKLAKVREGGPARARDRHLAAGKLLPRQRVETLLDAGTPFLEIGALAANGMYDDEAPGAGIITGIGRVSGTECVIVANDATVKGGTYYPLTVKKHLRAQEIASRTGSRASTSSTPAARSCRARTRCSPTANTSAASSTTRRGCRR